MYSVEALKDAKLRSADDKASIRKKVGEIRALNEKGIFDIDLTGINLNRANLRGVIVRYGRLDKADLTGADLREADFEGSWIVGAQLANANLSNSNFRAV